MATATTTTSHRRAYQYDGEGVAPKEIGDCETVNCSRGANFAQLNLRVSKSFALMGRSRIEAIGEVFNMLNALNPAFALTQQRLANGVQRAGIHSAQRIRGRLPAARTAGRTARLQVYVLNSGDESRCSVRLQAGRGKVRLKPDS